MVHLGSGGKAHLSLASMNRVENENEDIRFLDCERETDVESKKEEALPAGGSG